MILFLIFSRSSSYSKNTQDNKTFSKTVLIFAKSKFSGQCFDYSGKHSSEAKREEISATSVT